MFARRGLRLPIRKDLALLLPSAPCEAAANTTPESFERGPSGVLAPRCRWGVSSSKSNKKPTPARKPIAAGNTDQFPFPARRAEEGIPKGLVPLAGVRGANAAARPVGG